MADDNFRDLMKAFRQKKRGLENEIKESGKYIKFVKGKIKKLDEEESDAIAGIKNFDEDQLSIFDLGAIKNEYEQGGELDQEPSEGAGEPADEDMDDADDLDIEPADDQEPEEDESTGPIEFEGEEDDMEKAEAIR